MVRANCLKVKQKVISVDEQIIPSKIKRSRIWQFNRKKTVKWAFKMFLRARSSGIMYDFFLYSGKGSVGAENYFSEGSVMRLVKHLPQHKYHTLRFANWFTKIPLMLKSKAFGIIALGTIRSNQIQNCPMDTEKELKKSGCSSSSYRYN